MSQLYDVIATTIRVDGEQFYRDGALMRVFYASVAAFDGLCLCNRTKVGIMIVFLNSERLTPS